MTCVAMVRIGNVAPAVMEAMSEQIRAHFDAEVRQLPDPIEPRAAWDAKRSQYSSSVLLAEVAARWTPDVERILGVTEVDLFIPMLSFIYGQAQLGGRAAIVSLARLRQEFYQLAPEPQLLAERAQKEALHELGHTFGLLHCEDRSCAMSLSTNIRQVDLKTASFCAGCRNLLQERSMAAEKRI